MTERRSDDASARRQRQRALLVGVLILNLIPHRARSFAVQRPIARQRVSPFSRRRSSEASKAIGKGGSSEAVFGLYGVRLKDAPSRGNDTHVVRIEDSVDKKQQSVSRQAESAADDAAEAASRWLRWMTGGTPRGVAEVKMRDPEALGGVPRSDRYASRDWLHNTINLPNSAILHQIREPVFCMSGWAAFISLVHRLLLRRRLTQLASHFCLPTAPHSLMVSALGLLLVFRTNSAYQRFAEGRQIWEQILNTARDFSRLVKLYEHEIGAEKRRRVQRLLAAFPYLLRYRIRPNSIMKKIDDPDYVRNPENSLLLYQDHASIDNDVEAAAVATDEETTGKSRRKPRQLYWVDKSTLPWRLLPGKAMEECARAQNRPLWVCDRIAKELHSVPDGPTFSARERLSLLGKVDSLSRAIGACERIHQTVVPLNYARHALRCLTMWLLSLPFALVKDLGLMTGPVLFVISWMLFGVYEIGYSIEDPFQGTLRLSILCDAIRRDVLADELIRDSAFRLDEPVVSEKVMTNGSIVNSNIAHGKADHSFEEDTNAEGDYDDEETEDADFEIEDILIDVDGNVVTLDFGVKENQELVGAFVAMRGNGGNTESTKTENDRGNFGRP